MLLSENEGVQSNPADAGPAALGETAGEEGMATAGDERQATGLVTRIGARLFGARWTLLASSAAIAFTGIVGGVSTGLAVGAILAVLAVAALAPRATIRQRKAEAAAAARAPDLDGLTARHLAEAVPDPLLVVDGNAALVMANEAARTSFGALGIGSLLQLRFRAPEMQAMIERLTSGKAGPHVVEYAERVPIERWFRVVGNPVGEGTDLFVLVFKDQSEVRRIDRMRSDFIANASHELRTPLASIAGFIETIRGPARNDPKAQDNFLQIMQNQTARMARLIDDLLSLSRLEMKPYLAPSELIDVGPLVEGVVDALRHLAAETGVVIEKDISVAPLEIRGNRDELIQVFENLLENACKYGQSGGKVEVSATLEGEGGSREVQVAITDFGPGLAEEHIPRVTERFYRVDVETSRAQKGTGLGLAIVKHILTRHNARLSIRSELGKGATFTVHIPAP